MPSCSAFTDDICALPTTSARLPTEIRALPYQTLVRIFEKEGFTFARQSGDHRIYAKPGVKRLLVIPAYQSVPVFIIKNLLRSSGLTRERYFELLGQ